MARPKPHEGVCRFLPVRAACPVPPLLLGTIVDRTPCHANLSVCQEHASSPLVLCPIAGWEEQSVEANPMQDFRGREMLVE
ncbi:protein of unknown function [Cupriavidus neocaledonicus]|uniref:Uncharacterized protein n=1 Tax=Cupriavidus neocaledonicus TaxID=1040979 RepID=A0A375HAX6_9BURK|nr:protein of unknown function [Cupriavidus neocaledonicus]